MMKWTYDKTDDIWNVWKLESPIGTFEIWWGSWIKSDVYKIFHNKEPLDFMSSLEEAKEYVERYILNKTYELIGFNNVTEPQLNLSMKIAELREVFPFPKECDVDNGYAYDHPRAWHLAEIVHSPEYCLDTMIRILKESK